MKMGKCMERAKREREKKKVMKRGRLKQTEEILRARKRAMGEEEKVRMWDLEKENTETKREGAQMRQKEHRE